MMSAEVEAPDAQTSPIGTSVERQNSPELQNRANGLKPKACNNCRQQKASYIRPILDQASN